MVKDIHNEDSEEEEKNKNLEQDKDFGLPDLEFEDLEELDFDESTSQSSDDEILTGSEDISISSESEKGGLSDDLLLGDMSSELANEELEDLMAPVDSIADGAGMGSTDDQFQGQTESISSDEYDLPDFDKKESIFESDAISNQFDSDESSSTDGSIFESDSIALESNINEKVEFQSPEDASLPSDYKPYTSEKSIFGNFAKVIIIGVVVIGLIGAGFLYFSWQSKAGNLITSTVKIFVTIPYPFSEGNEIVKTENNQDSVKKVAESIVSNDKDVDSTRVEDEKLSIEKKEEKIPVVKKPVDKKPVDKKESVQTVSSGEILKVKQRTGRVYAIIGSFIDEDIAMDFANELSNQGKEVKIVYPFGKSINHRVAIADYSSISEAIANIDKIKTDYREDGAWVLKY